MTLVRAVPIRFAADTPFAGAPAFECCPIMAFRRRQRALEQHLSRADPRQPAYAGCCWPKGI